MSVHHNGLHLGYPQGQLFWLEFSLFRPLCEMENISCDILLFLP